jgi:predicted dehydrogenase
VRLGFIGIANRGGQLIKATLPHKDAEIVALCDVYDPICAQRKEELGGTPTTYSDYRKMIESEKLDGVVIGTPDHWHALQTIDACRAGLDVYVEKPLAYTIHEGSRMVKVARETKRVVQVGTHRRSSKMLAELAERVQAGEFGHITVVRAYRLSNMFPTGMGKTEDSDPPEDLDWDMWIGPRPYRPFRENIAPYKFRWWKSYSSQMANWGVHYFDLFRWMLDEKAIASVSCHGGKYCVDDDRTIPDTMEAIFEFDSGRLMLFGQYEAAGNPMMPGAEFELRGTKGTVYGNGRKYWVVPEKGGQFMDRDPRMEAFEVEGKDGNSDLTAQHMRNFLDCVKSRELPNADVEEGHRSTTVAHLGNIALDMKARVNWDAEAERISSPEEANERLHYEYREPWTLG